MLVQKLAKNDLEKMMALNPTAMKLRTQRGLVEAEIAVALATGQLEVVAALKLRRRQILLQQKTLDQLQKSILTRANTNLANGAWDMQHSLSNLLRKNQNRQNAWVNYNFTTLSPKIPILAITPKDQKLAPEYRLKKDFENQQALSLTWFQDYNWKSFMKYTNQNNNRQKSQCRVTLEENTWKTKIQKDRLL